MVVKNIAGFSFVLIGLSFCIPYSIVTDNASLNNVSWWLYLLVRLVILFSFFYFIFFRGKKIYPLSNGVIIISCLILFLSLIYSLIDSDTKEFLNWVNTIIYFVLFFYISYYDRITLKTSFRLFNLLFYLTTLYVIIDYYTDYHPYRFLYAENLVFSKETSSIYRAKGVLGHPLILSALVIIYQFVLYIKAILYKEFSVFGFLLVLFVGLLTVSKTVLIILFFQFIIYYFLSKSYKSLKKNFILITFFLVASFTTFLFNNSIINNFFERVESSEVDHRAAAYQSSFDFFVDNVFGVGREEVMSKIVSGGYSAPGLVKDFNTLDNFFLTQIAGYGIFSILVFMFYFFFLTNSFFYRKIDKRMFRLNLLLGFLWCSLAFSFNLEHYMCILILFAFLYSLLLKEIDYKRHLLKKNIIKY